VSVALKIIKALNLGWEVLDVSSFDYEGGAGSILRQKIRRINEWEADVAVESHFNAASSPKARGCETLYFSLPGAGNRFSPSGKLLAELVQAATLKTLNGANIRVPRPVIHVKDRGAKGMADLRRIYNGKETVPRFSFLTQTKMPAIILEPLFITSPLDTLGLAKDRKREVHRLALGAVTGLIKWNVRQGKSTT
jgi:N-acetylmuramoyl-L-alanine amidase